MKRFTTIVFAALVAVTLSMPAWAQVGSSSSQAPKTETKQTKGEKKQTKKADKAAKKETKKASKKDASK